MSPDRSLQEVFFLSLVCPGRAQTRPESLGATWSRWDQEDSPDHTLFLLLIQYESRFQSAEGQR